MPELEITVKTKDGKEIAISDVSAKTWAEIHKADAEARKAPPIAQLATFMGKKAAKLILRISPRLKSRIATSDANVISIDLNTGERTNGWVDVSQANLVKVYGDLQDLTPKD